MTIMYMRGTTTLVITQFATIIPRVGDKVVIGTRKFTIAEIVWHIDSDKTWIEVQI